ncbi:MAG: tetratricopeptide repeat protein, partial [Gemmatimonadota bacterium]
MKGYQQFFAELKRRKVFKVAAVYGVVAFGVLQAADIALPRLGLPDWTVTFMLAVVLLAFPVALILAWAFEVTPDGVRRTEDAEPEEIEAIVGAPASKRWPSGLLALLGVAALVGSTWWLARETAPGTGAGEAGAAGAESGEMRFSMADPADDGRPSLAVLPFADMSPGRDQGYFSDGITEEILNTLARVRELKVAARTSAFAFKDRQLDLRDVGDSLGVEYLIEGSVRKAGEQLRITAQLIDAADGTHLWSESYNRTMDDVFAIQSEIAEAIAGELRVSLGLDDPGELVTPTENMEAFDLYLAARAQLRQRGENLNEAIRLFEAAISRDSSWAPAWAGLAEAREIVVWYPGVWPDAELEAGHGLSIGGNREAWRRGIDARLGPAEHAARRALELDPSNASAHVALGSVLRDRRQWQASEDAYRRALELDPDNAEAYHQYAELMVATGRVATAVRLAARAAELDPAPVRRGTFGWMLVVDRRTEEALPVLREAVRDAGGRLPLVASTLVREELRRDNLDEAEAAARGNFDSEYVDLLFRALRANDPSLAPGPLDAEQWMWFGRHDSAAAEFARLSEASVPLDIYRIWHPVFDPIRDRPEMRAFLRSVNLGDAELRRTPRSEIPGEAGTGNDDPSATGPTGGD